MGIIIMDSLYIGLDPDTGELVETNAEGYTEGMDTVVISQGRKLSWAEQACKTLDIEP
jgi:hypothetical protein